MRLLWVLLLVPLLTTQDEIGAGETVFGTLSPADVDLAGYGSAKSWWFLAPSNGTYTISLESYDFDAYLRVTREDGTLLAEDDNGGIETNARTAFRAEVGVRYRITAAARVGEHGELVLKVIPGGSSLPSGGERWDLAIAFRALAAERALERGDRRTAARHRHFEGIHCFNRGKLEEARAAHQAALDLARRLGERNLEAVSRNRLGQVCIAIGEPEKARRILVEAISIWQELGDRDGEAWALLGLGRSERSIALYPEAREHLEQALTIFRERNPEGEGWTLLNLGGVCVETGEYDRAEEHLARSAARFRELGNLSGQAWSLEHLARVCSSRGDTSKAKEYSEKALVLSREQGDLQGEAAALGGLAGVLWTLADYEGARASYERQLSLAIELEDRPTQAATLMNLGLICFALSDYAEAREYYERSSALNPRSARLLGNLGYLHLNLRDYERARESFREQLALAREAGERPEEALALSGLGSISHGLGDYLEARDHYQGALELARRIGERPQEARLLWMLGHLYVSHLSDELKAREHLESGLELARELGLQRERAGLELVWGVLLKRRQQYEESIERVSAALELQREIGNRVGEAYSLNLLAHVHLELGDREQAKRLAEAALALSSGSNEAAALDCLETIVSIELAEGDLESAESVFERAVDLLQRPFVPSLDIEHASGLRSRFSVWGQAAQDLTALRLAEPGTGDEEVQRAIAEGFRHAGLWKGRALLEGIVEHHRGGRTQEAIELRRAWRETLARRDGILQRVSNAIYARQEPEEVEQLRARARSLLSEAEELARRLEEVSPVDAALSMPKKIEPETVRFAATDEETVLIDYAEGTDRLYAYVLTKRDLRFLDLGPMDVILQAVSRFLGGITSPSRLASVREVFTSGSALFDLLLEPALESSGESSIQRLIIAPSASLAGAPFDALVASSKSEAGPTRFLDLEFAIDRYQILYAPSSPVLAELADLGPRRETGRVLILADPRYPSEADVAEEPGIRPKHIPLLGGDRSSPSARVFGRIRHTRREALGLAHLLLQVDRERDAAAELVALSDRRSGALSAAYFDLHLGEQASTKPFAGDLRRYAILHLAAHGYIDQDSPRDSGLVLAFEDGESGLLTIGDVLDLDLDANLVVLSACETARGEVRAGEGVQSLARAFMYAGARSVVASLWQVPDREAAETMEVFYRGILRGGRTPSEALHEAKLALRGSKAVRGLEVEGRHDVAQTGVESGHPFFWAPFIYIGLSR